MTKRTTDVLLLLLLLGFPLLAILPNQLGAVRVAGLSLLWWYGGVIAPLLAWLIAVVRHPASRPPSGLE